MRCIVVGASAGLGRALVVALAARRHDLLLVASDMRDLEAVARDAAIRHGVTLACHAADLAAADPKSVRAQAIDKLGGIDAVIYVAGVSNPRRDSGQVDDELLQQYVAVNQTSAMRLINACMGDIMANRGVVVGAGSVAAVRGRRQNVVYAAAKRGLEFYFEALRHKAAADGSFRVLFYRMGFLRTAMTYGQKLPLPAMPPAAAAERIANDLVSRDGIYDLPGWWRYIGLILRYMPWAVFKRLDI